MVYIDKTRMSGFSETPANADARVVRISKRTIIATMIFAIHRSPIEYEVNLLLAYTLIP